MSTKLVLKQTKDVAPPKVAKFFEYSQNNSGGSFTGPALFVIVEAHDAQEADRRAEDLGLYFDGCDTGQDCSCCGDRWYTAWGEGDEVPSIYGKPITEMKDKDVSGRKHWCKRDKVPYAIISYLDGREETLAVR